MRKISNQHEFPYLFEKLKSIKDLEKQEFNQEWIRKLHSLKLEDIQKENINYSEIIYQNQFDCAVQVIMNMLSWFTDLNENEHTSRNRHGLISAEPQVGKTGLTAAIYNIMNVTGLLGYWDIKYIWLITGMDDCGLRKQNKNRLKSQFIGANDENIDWGENGEYDELRPFKVFKRIDLKNMTKKGGLKCNNALILIDEAHYADGKKTILTNFLEKNGVNWKNTNDLKDKQIFILAISATNFSQLFSDLVDSKRHSILKRGKGYYGIPEFINEGQIYDASQNDFKFNKELNDYPINHQIKNELTRLNESPNHKGVGILIVRAGSKKEKIIEQDTFINENFRIEYLNSSQGNINYDLMIDLHENLQLPNKKPILFLIKGGFRAGLTIPQEIKDSISFIYDNSENPATTAQGLMGRLCGYRDNLELAKFTKIYVNKFQAVGYSDHVENNFSRDTIPSKSVYKDRDELTPLDFQKINDSSFNKETDIKHSSKYIDKVEIPLTYDQTLELYEIYYKFEKGNSKKTDTISKGAKNRIQIQNFLEQIGANKFLNWDFIGEPYIAAGAITGKKIDGENSKDNFQYSPDTKKKFIFNDKPGGIRTESHSHFKYVFGGSYDPEKHLGKRAIHVILRDDNENEPYVKLVLIELTVKYRLPNITSHYKEWQDTGKI